MSYLTVKQTAMRYPAFTEKAIWGYIADRKNNGFDVCTAKIGNKRIIFEDEFNVWVRTIGKNKNQYTQKQEKSKNWIASNGEGLLSKNDCKKCNARAEEQLKQEEYEEQCYLMWKKTNERIENFYKNYQ